MIRRRTALGFAVLMVGSARIAGAQADSGTTLADRLQRVERSNARRLEITRAMFVEAGCANENLRLQSVPGRPLSNVICQLRGESDTTIVVSAHYDMTGPGLGVGDNWGSVSVLVTLYRALQSQRPRHTFVFIAFADEELGMVGATHYVKALRIEDIRRIRAVVNMDGVGMASPAVWDSRANPRLLRLLDSVALSNNLAVRRLSLDGAGAMDSFPFDERGIPTVSIHGLAPGNFGVPHSRRDDLSAVKLDVLQDSFLLILRYLRALDAS